MGFYFSKWIFGWGSIRNISQKVDFLAKKWGFNQEKPQKHDFSHYMGLYSRVGLHSRGYGIWRPKVVFPFFISCHFIFFPNECPGLSTFRRTQTLKLWGVESINNSVLCHSKRVVGYAGGHTLTASTENSLYKIFQKNDKFLLDFFFSQKGKAANEMAWTKEEQKNW